MTVEVPEAVYQRLQKLADLRGTSVDELVAEITSGVVSVEDVEAQRSILRRRAARGREVAAERGTSPEEVLRSLLDRAAESEDPEDQSA
jgi:predicted transcriptional regulator